MLLTQAEADALVAMAKTFVKPVPIALPPGTDQSYDLVGEDAREQFILDVWRSTFRLSKVKYQTRGRKVIVLVRLDIDGAPHTNPDGELLSGTHLHLYREGYEDKWATPVGTSDFANLRDIEQALIDFCRFCNIHGLPPLQGVIT